MKKILISFLLLACSTPLFAQYAAPGYGFRLGLTAHPTFGWLNPEEGKGNGLALGFSYGLLGDFNFADNYSFATGITITTINGKSTEISPLPFARNSDIMETYDLRYKLQYLEIPMTVKLKTEKIGDIRWYGQFGLSNDFKIGAKGDASRGSTDLDKDLNISDYTKFYRAGLILGAGGEFDLDHHTSITLGLSYNNGFTNIVKNDNRSVKNHYVGINFGVFF